MSPAPDPTSTKLVDAILDDRLVEQLASPVAAGLDPEHPLLVEATACVERIGATAARHRQLIADAFGATARVPATESRQQRPVAVVEVDPARVRAARQTLVERGYEPVDRLSEGAWESVRRVRSSARFAGTEGDGMQVRLVWGPEPEEPSRWRAALRPGPRDWSRIHLPGGAWPVYHLLRGAWLVRDRLGIAPPAAFAAVHLPTPTSLVAPLLRFAGVGPDDVLLDVGCSDGRVLIEAAVTIGCRGLGVDTDGELVARAEEAVRAADLADRIELVTADVADTDIGRATAAFLFLPPRSLAPAVDLLHRKLPKGAVVVAHEQARLPDGLTPEVSAPVLADAALTVAHRWVVGG